MQVLWFRMPTDMATDKNPGIVIAGTILVDIIKTVPVYPEAGRLVQYLDMEQSCGGAVPNTAIDLAKIDPDFPVAYSARSVTTNTAALPST